MEEIVYVVGKYSDGRDADDKDWKYNYTGTDPASVAIRYGHVLELFTRATPPPVEAVTSLTPNTDERLTVTHNGREFWCIATVRWVGDTEPEGWSTYMAEYKKWIEAGNGTDQMPDYRDASWYEDFLNWKANGEPVDWANPPGTPAEPIEWDRH